jgi:5'-3' exonuclease
MKIHLIDGTYELFRGYYGPPPRQAPDGREVGATIALLRSLLALLNDSDVTHVGCAFDHVVESFRNDLYDGYKTGEGIDPKLKGQFELAEEAVAALGLTVWPMVEFEADDAIAAAVVKYQDERGVEQVVICSPDKDLAQLVSGGHVVCWDRRRELVYDEAAVVEKFGIGPESIPDYLALVGDSADGIPGVPAWGAKSVATVLAKYPHIEDIPDETDDWGITPGRAKRLRENLNANWENAFLYRRLTTLRTDVPLKENLADLEWHGATEAFRQLCADLGSESLLNLVKRWQPG